MGCDIHAFLERKVDGEWVMVKPIESNQYGGGHFGDRDYTYFGALAGVRTEGPEAKGIPDDVSASTKLHIDDWEGDGHSHSYMPLSEAKALHEFLYPECSKWEDGKETKFVPNDRYYYLFDEDEDTMEEYRGGIDNHRVVFFFDN